MECRLGLFFVVPAYNSPFDNPTPEYRDVTLFSEICSTFIDKSCFLSRGHYGLPFLAVPFSYGVSAAVFFALLFNLLLLLDLSHLILARPAFEVLSLAPTTVILFVHDLVLTFFVFFLLI